MARLNRLNTCRLPGARSQITQHSAISMIKRFLILSNLYPTDKTPFKGVFVKNIEQSLINSGVDVQRIVLAGRHNNKLIKVLHYITYIFRALFRLLFTDRVVYLHYVAHSSIPYLLASSIRKLEMVAHVHGGDVMPALHEPENVRKIKVWIAKKALAKAAKIIVPSHYFKGFLIDEYGLCGNRIFVSPSGGVDTDNFSVKSKKLPSFITHKIAKFGYVGRLDSSKGVDTLLRALNKLKVDFMCEIVGTGICEKEFIEQAKQLGLASKVTFHGAKRQMDLADFYSSFDYLVFPSEMLESLGLVGLEAMACGTPVIGTMNAGMADYLIDEINGFGFESGNAESLTKCLYSSCQVNLDDYQKLSDAAREKALEYDAKVCTTGLLKVLQ